MSPIGWRILAAAVALAPAAAWAADAPAPVAWVKSNEGPMGQVAAEGVWVQRLIVFRNNDSKDRTVKVACLEDVGQRGQQIFSRICTIPAGTERRVELAVRPGQRALFEKATEGAPPKPGAPVQLDERYAIWDARDGTMLQGEHAPSTQVFPRDVNLGLIPGEIDPREWYLYLEHMETQPLGQVRLLASMANQYATRWYGYSMVRVLILTDPVAARIRPSQMTALLDWTRRGGVLVLAGANQLAEALQGELGEAAGVTAVSVHYVSKMRVSGLVSSSGGLVEKTLGEPLPLAELVPAGAEVLHECNGMPLLTRNGLGEGAVFTLAMPLFSLDKQMNEVWGSVNKQLLRLPPVQSDDFLKSEVIRGEASALARTVEEDQNLDTASPADKQRALAAADDLRFYAEPALAVLRSLAGRKAPPRWVPVAVLAAMAAAVAAGGAVLRRRRRGELLWLVLAPAAILLAAVLYLVGLGLSNPAESLSFVGLVSSLGDGRARVQEAYSYYSGSADREVTFTAGCEDGVVVDAGQVGAGSVSRSEIRTDREMLLPDQTVKARSDRAIYVDGVVGGLKFQPDLSFDSQGLAGTIQNDLGFDLSSAVIYVNDRTYRLGTDGSVPQGRSAVSVPPEGRLGLVEAVGLQQLPSPPPPARTGALSPPPQPARRGGRGAPPAPTPPPAPPAPAAPIQLGAKLSRGEFTASLSYVNTDVLRNRLLGCLAVAQGSFGKEVGESPVLIGYGARNVLDPLKGRPVDGGRKGWDVVVWPLRFKSPAPGTAVKVPSGFARVQYGEGADANVFHTVVQTKDLFGAASVIVRAQLPAGMPRLKDAKATLTLHASAMNFHLAVLGRVASTKRDQEIMAADRPQGAIRVEVPSADAFATPGGAYLFVLRFGPLGSRGEDSLLVGNTFEGADVDLEGIAP